MLFKAVHKGIDSLYLSYKGELKERMLNELEHKWHLAQSADLGERAKGVVQVLEHRFCMERTGRKHYQFILKDNWMQIEVSKHTGFPALYIQLRSEFLNVKGLEYAKAHVRKVAEQFIKGQPEEIVSRLDIFVDFISEMDFGNIQDMDWITRNLVQKNITGGVCCGWDIGRGSDLSMRLYDKTAEIKPEQDYFMEFWRKAGWADGQQVWRAEFQLRRGQLKQHPIHSLCDLTKSINEIWRYCTNKWLRLSVPDGTINRTRLKTNPWWLEIQNVRFGDGTFAGVSRKPRKNRMPEEKHIYPQTLGYICSHLACNGQAEINLNTMTHLIRKLEAFFKKRHFDGQGSFNKMVKAKIAEKKRQFNIE